MTDPATSRLVESVFPFIADLSPENRAEFDRTAKRIELAAGDMICLEGTLCVQIPMVISGCGRVYRTSNRGRALTLYRIEPGESCILTASCILSNRPFPAFAEAETDVDVLAVPAPSLRTWFGTSPAWRAYIFGLLARRFSEVIELVDAVSFRRVDERLAAYLIVAAGDGETVGRTHEAVAEDLGTSREVVSRILKEFEREGLIETGRGSIVVLDKVGLGVRSRPERM